MSFLLRRWQKQQEDKSLEMCKLCGRRYKSIESHVFRVHLMGMKEYRKTKRVFKEDN
jgi:hypothetical protein